MDERASVAAATRETAATWRVREATPGDARAIAEAVHALLVELGGKPAAVDAIEREAQALLRDPDMGALLVAETGEVGLVGVLGASWLSALHIPGRYGLIQELWVHPSWRGLTIGHDLLDAVFALARELRIARVEVGLPSDGFAGLAATEAFYRRNGFELLGARMRRTLL
jgi:GNAT superfamily N-acetyltransferase